jgi:hypothetical protein
VIETDPKDGTPPFVRCNSSLPFVNPTVADCDTQKTAKEINQELNLNLGLPIINPNNSILRNILRLFNFLFISWWEDWLFAAWDGLPLPVKKRLVFVAWGWYSQAHKKLLGRSTAIHPDASEEYHALTTIMWWGRLFPVTVKRMRFSLKQLTVWTKPPILSRVERVDEIAPVTKVPPQQLDHCNVHGVYIHTQDTPTQRVIFWLYGGAFLSGDVDGNIGPGTTYVFFCVCLCLCVLLLFYSLYVKCTYNMSGEYLTVFFPSHKYMDS